MLKVGHHGSNSSTSYLFLREIMPTYAVISVGKDNSYGHPTETVLSRLRDADVTVYRTDLQGDVFCYSDGKTVTFGVDRNTQANTLSPAVSNTPAPTPTPTPAPIVSAEPERIGSEYIYNKNTKKFHYPSCNSVKQMSEENKGYITATRDEMLSLGYSPCGNCDP